VTYRSPIGFALAAVLLFVATGGASAGEALDAATRRVLDTFFSNFSEARVESFTPATLSDEALLNFALTHNYINNFKALKPSRDKLSVLVPAAVVDQTTEKYFGRTLSVHPGAPYSVPLADGEAVPFSQIRTLTARGEAGHYQAAGIIYQPGGPGALDVHATPQTWKTQGEEVQELGRFTAAIDKVRSGGTERWVLREYSVPAVGARPGAAAIPIAVLGNTFSLHTGLSRGAVKKELAPIFADAPSVDNAQRLQYDVPLVPDLAPVSFVFDFDRKGVLDGIAIDAYEKAQNPTVQGLVTWLTANAGPPRLGRKGESAWEYGGWRITHRFGGSGEDSSYSMEFSRGKSQ